MLINHSVTMGTLNFAITQWFRLEGTAVGHLVQCLCSNRAIQEHIAQDCIQVVLEYLQ